MEAKKAWRVDTGAFLQSHGVSKLGDSTAINHADTGSVKRPDVFDAVVLERLRWLATVDLSDSESS